jgi:8-oxo-dGTP pyrophosphatase MutT (NUDIX family)
MTFTAVVSELEGALARPLPGADAHMRLAPMPRRVWPAGFDIARIREAAALLLVFPKNLNAEFPGALSEEDSVRTQRAPRSTAGKAHIILTVRAHGLGRHGGQVSLPGGVVEPGETFEQAALREAHEEIGLSPQVVRILGALTPLEIPVSGFRLHPIVGVTVTRPTLSPAAGEVARILEVAIDDLRDPQRLRHVRQERDGVALTIPGFHIGDQEIWGATAMVLAEFLALLGWPAREGE